MAENSVVTHVNDFLDQRKVKYILTTFSGAHTSREIVEAPQVPRRGFVKCTLIRVRGKIVMVLVSSNHRLDFNHLPREFGDPSAQSASSEEIREFYPEGEISAIPPFGSMFGIAVYVDMAIKDEESHLTFSIGSSNYLLNMAFRDYVLLETPIFKKIPVVPRYKASIQSVDPKSTREDLERLDRCFLLTSLGNRNFDRARLEAIVHWISNHFRECKVLVTDWIYRITLMVSNPNLQPRRARDKAIRLGREFAEKERPVFDRYSERCFFYFVFGSECETTSEYHFFLQRLQSLYREDPAFQESIDSFGKQYLLRRSADPGQELYRRNADLSNRYLLEEMAQFACFVQQGWRVMIYPGSLTPLVQLSEGLHPRAPKELQQLINVSLRLRRSRKKHSVWSGDLD